MRPSLLPEVYWSHTLHDLRTLTKLYIQHEMIRTLSITEGMATVAGQIFGGSSGSDGDYQAVESEQDILALTRMVNSG